MTRPGSGALCLNLLFCLLAGCGRPQIDGGKKDSAHRTGSSDRRAAAPAWEIRNPSVTEWPVGPVAKGPAGYVNRSPTGLRYSADGIHWTAAKVPAMKPEESYVSDVIYGGGQFVALAGKSVLVSPDGAEWTRVAEGRNSPASIAYGDGKYAIVGTGCVMASRDGLAWSSVETDTSVILTSVAYGNGVFVATRGWPEEIWSSQDGLAWTRIKHVYGTRPEGADNATPIYVLFGNGRFLTVGWRDYQSVDGSHWSALKPELGIYTYAHFQNGRFLAFTYSDGYGIRVLAHTSTDLATWKTDTTDLPWPFSPGWMAYINGHYVTRTSGISGAWLSWISEDLIHWSSPGAVTTQDLFAIAFGGGRFVALGRLGALLTSADGISWALAEKPPAKDLRGLAFGNGSFVAIGTAGTLLHSRDGTAWSQAATDMHGDFSNLGFTDGSFMVSGDSGVLLESRDGSNWSRRGALPAGCYGFVRGNGKLLAYGGGDWISADGIHWKPSFTGATFNHSHRALFDGRRFLIEGNNDAGDLQLASEDGVYWRQTRAGRMADLNVFPDQAGEFSLFDNGLYWTSQGATYAIELPTALNATVCYGKGMFVGVGDGGMIATLKAPYAPDRPRAGAEKPSGGNPGSFQDRRFIGNMEHEHVFILQVSSDGENLGGEYSYLGRKQSLKVKGRIEKDGGFHLQETTEADQVTGAFDGKFLGPDLFGEWSTVDRGRRYLVAAHEAAPGQVEEKLRSFMTAHSAWVGVYQAYGVYEQASDGTRYDCVQAQGRWACGDGVYQESWKTPIKGHVPDLGFKPVEAIRLEVRPDFSMELSIHGQVLWSAPLKENRMAYDSLAFYIAKGIKIREFESRADKVPFVLTRNQDGGGFELKQEVYANERSVSLRLGKK